jgi:hypothetical protein
LSAPNFAKRKRMEQAEDSSPDPSSSACEIRNEPRFCGNHIPRKKIPQNRVLLLVRIRILFVKSSDFVQQTSQKTQNRQMAVCFLWCHYSICSNLFPKENGRELALHRLADSAGTRNKKFSYLFDLARGKIL